MKSNSLRSSLTAVLLLFACALFSQVAINPDGTPPDNSAMLDVKSTNKGVLIPRMTQSKIGSIPCPANGLVVFCTTDSKIYIYIAEAKHWKELSFGTSIILPPTFTCGSPFKINHVEGTIAPVDKEVTYSTVTGIPGVPSKCWITSNLGADHQATIVSDTSEVSAGWYWQFNRKQGYKHDGSIRTPNFWIFSIIEDLEWQASNDPCTIELGSGWRIPTYTEWENVALSGGWNDWLGPWNSGLKLHAAGYLSSSDGSLSGRGTLGNLWCSTQGEGDIGWTLYFGSSYYHMYYSNKVLGFSLRCLRDVLANLTTDTITGIFQYSAICGGNITDDGGANVIARGVCWSINQFPTISDAHSMDGSGTGQFVSNITGLNYATKYYVRAYATNSVGTAYGNQVSFIAGIICNSFILSHTTVSGVAPVAKTIAYGTLITNLSGVNKCWITSNLGADHQATIVSDTSEASAGWYWQFNRKQGYKHDGTSRTPNSSWISSINESSDWTASNDPCTIEIGNGWRIPTYTEWYCADSSGGWYYSTDAFYSILHLHDAGSLNFSNGSLNYRGSRGFYWSNSQNEITDGWNLFFLFDYYTGYSGISFSNKANGYTLRCLKD